ncbi:MAG: hypothetical protein M3R22_12735 [Pseudomonadota bacterium]|nr:hypothetical protein [Pseudomonadota bacterium]
MATIGAATWAQTVPRGKRTIDGSCGITLLMLLPFTDLGPAGGTLSRDIAELVAEALSATEQPGAAAGAPAMPS